MFSPIARSAANSIRAYMKSRSRSQSRGRSRSRSSGKLGFALGMKRPASRSRTRVRVKPRLRKPSGGRFNSGYNLVNMKARNTARRSMRHKRVRRTIVPAALMARCSLNYVQRNEIELSRGRVLLPNMSITTLANTPDALPLHVYELDMTPLSGTSVANIMQLYRLPGTGAFYFGRSQFVKNAFDGETSTTEDYVLNSSAVSSLWKDCPEDPTTKRKWYQKRVTCEMLLYGQNNQDTLYRIDIVRMDPRFAAKMGTTAPQGDSGAGTEPDSVVLEEWNQFWYSLVAPYTQNPTYKPRRVSNAMKVVKSFKYKIPEQSADYDRQNCVKTKFTLPMNRIVNRYWKKGAGSLVSFSDSTTNPEDAVLLNNQTVDDFSNAESENGRIVPGARYYMIVRATNTDKRNNTGAAVSNYPIAVTPGQDPTYDIQLRSEYLVDL